MERMRHLQSGSSKQCKSLLTLRARFVNVRGAAVVGAFGFVAPPAAAAAAVVVAGGVAGFTFLSGVVRIELGEGIRDVSVVLGRDDAAGLED